MKHSGLLKTCKVIRHISDRSKKIWIQTKAGKVGEKKNIVIHRGTSITGNTLPCFLLYFTSVFVNLFENRTPTADQSEQHCHSILISNKENFSPCIISFSLILFVSLLNVWEGLCAL